VIVRRIVMESPAAVALGDRALHHDAIPTLRGRLWRQSTIGDILNRGLHWPIRHNEASAVSRRAALSACQAPGHAHRLSLA
jgi:hypothetical protein